ncbi:MAG: hypothetical protein RSC93_00820 [Erysipelotrichaceae bacterium]
MKYYYITGNKIDAIAYTDNSDNAYKIFCNVVIDDVLNIREIEKSSVVLGYIPLVELLEYRDVKPHTIFWDSSINIR